MFISTAFARLAQTKVGHWIAAADDVIIF